MGNTRVWKPPGLASLKRGRLRFGLHSPKGCEWHAVDTVAKHKQGSNRQKISHLGHVADMLQTYVRHFVMVRFLWTVRNKSLHRGFLRLRNPNSGPNSVKRILDARILDPNSWVEFIDSVFSSKRGPLKNSPSRNSPPKIHLPKFNPEIGPKNSHCTPAGPFV